MKNNKMKILVMFMSLGASMAWDSFAGTPEQDPVIAKLHNEFAIARVPSNADLKFGKTWECSFYSAQKDDFFQESYIDAFAFHGYDGLVQNSGWMITNALVITDTGLEGINATGCLISFRVTSNGDLIGEFSLANADPKSGSVLPSVARPVNKVTDFLACPVDRTSSR